MSACTEYFSSDDGGILSLRNVSVHIQVHRKSKAADSNVRVTATVMTNSRWSQMSECSEMSPETIDISLKMSFFFF